MFCFFFQILKQKIHSKYHGYWRWNSDVGCWQNNIHKHIFQAFNLFIIVQHQLWMANYRVKILQVCKSIQWNHIHIQISRIHIPWSVNIYFPVSYVRKLYQFKWNFTIIFIMNWSCHKHRLLDRCIRNLISRTLLTSLVQLIFFL